MASHPIIARPDPGPRACRRGFRGRTHTRRRAAFSLVEILVVIALIGLLAAVVAMNVTSMAGGLGPRPLPEILKRAVRDARFEAAFHKEVVTLRFDQEAGAFIVSDSHGNVVRSRESGYGLASGAVQVRFHQILPKTGTSAWSVREERAPIPAVRFHPDRSSTPFIAEIEINGESSEHRYDPFSNLEIVDAES